MSKLSEEVAKGDTGAGLPWAETEMTKIGDTVHGNVFFVDFKQAFNPETKQPATWERSGDAIMEVIVKVSDTGKFRPELDDDNGDRAFHIRWAFESKTAFIEAMQAQGVLEPAIGGKFAAQLVGFKQNGGVRKPTKLFKYEYMKPPSNLAQAVAEPNGDAAAASTPAVAPATDPWGNANQATTTAATDPWGNPVAPAQAPAQVAAQAPAQVAAPAAPKPSPEEQLAQIKGLIGFGLSDQNIADVTGAPMPAIVAIRAAGA